MNIEIRKFKHKTFMLLTTETEEENKALDALFDSKSPYAETKLDATVTTDDAYVPYIRIQVK